MLLVESFGFRSIMGTTRDFVLFLSVRVSHCFRLVLELSSKLFSRGVEYQRVICMNVAGEERALALLAKIVDALAVSEYLHIIVS